VAGGEHSRICVRAATIDDRENSAIWVVADLKIVLVNESEGAQAEVRKIASGFWPAGLAQFRSIDEHEPDSEIAFDIEGVSVNDPGHITANAQRSGVGTRGLARRWRKDGSGVSARRSEKADSTGDASG